LRQREKEVLKKEKKLKKEKQLVKKGRRSMQGEDDEVQRHKSGDNGSKKKK
jgi:hypothetical protein